MDNFNCEIPQTSSNYPNIPTNEIIICIRENFLPLMVDSVNEVLVLYKLDSTIDIDDEYLKIISTKILNYLYDKEIVPTKDFDQANAFETLSNISTYFRIKDNIHELGEGAKIFEESGGKDFDESLPDFAILAEFGIVFGMANRLANVVQAIQISKSQISATNKNALALELVEIHFNLKDFLSSRGNHRGRCPARNIVRTIGYCFIANLLNDEISPLTPELIMINAIKKKKNQWANLQNYFFSNK